MIEEKIAFINDFDDKSFIYGECNIEQCSILEIEEHEDRCDFIVSSSKLNKEYSIPSINGISFLTGVGEEETKEQILKLLKG